VNDQQSSISIWHRQFWHLLCILALLLLAWWTWNALGKPVTVAYWVAIICPVIHQVYVWLAWRLELRSGLVSNLIGFKLYVVIFFILFASRFISLIFLAWADQNGLGLGLPARITITCILMVPGIYTLYSVRRYFGLERAAGVDHFDPGYRTKPWVKKGIFRFTNNAMYVYAFLLFWAIAIGFNSASALAVAAYSHLYIWVHYFCTEKPDMDFIYSATSDRTN